MKELVLAIWDRDYTWINKLSNDIKITKYNKNLNTLKDDHIFLSTNVGRDVHTFFYHIVNRYETLSEYTFFAQDYIEDHVNNYTDIINGDINDIKNNAIQDLGGCWFFNTDYNYILECNSNGEPQHGGLPLERIWNLLFNKPLPEPIRFTAAGHFCITKEHAHQYPVEWYKKILNVLETEEVSPWCIERFEPYIFENKKNKEVVAILSHANSDDKIDILKRNIECIKKQGYDVILSSHIQVPESIINLVDYFIYDKSNPLIMWNEYDHIGGNVSYWSNFPTYTLTKKLDYNHSYAVLKLMNQCAYLASSNDYNKIHFINYDYIIKDKSVLKTNSKYLNIYDSYYYGWGDSNSVSTGFFSFNVDKFIIVFGDIKSKYDYCSHGISILENFFIHLSNINNLNYYVEDRENIMSNNEIDIINQNQIYGLYQIEDYEVRLIITIFDGKYYIFVSTNKEDNENYLNIYHKGRYYSFDIISTHFIEIPFDIINDGFDINFSKLEINMKVNLDSNISDCTIKDPSIIVKFK